MTDLYYVDDQRDFLPSLQMDIAWVDNINLKDYVGAYQPAEFLKAFEAGHIPKDSAAFLLDLAMPTPPILLKNDGLWANNERGDDHFCGIALAKYLKENGIDLSKIALITHWANLETAHNQALEQLQLHNIKRISKGHATQLKNWLRLMPI